MQCRIRPTGYLLLKVVSDSSPIILDVQTGEVASVAHVSLEIGEMADFELVTRVSGESDWFGLLRTGNIGGGAIFNDVLIGLQENGTFLRSDSLEIGRDAQVRAGTVSSGSERTKSDLRYKLEERGGGIKVLGSILSAESMHLDHHIEIHHEAPDTFSRLSWHSACGGDSKTVGTGMLQVSKGAKGLMLDKFSIIYYYPIPQRQIQFQNWK